MIATGNAFYGSALVTDGIFTDNITKNYIGKVSAELITAKIMILSSFANIIAIRCAIV